MYARNPSIILQNMNFSRYYRYRAQLIYSFDLNIIIINNCFFRFMSVKKHLLITNRCFLISLIPQHIPDGHRRPVIPG